MRPPRLKDNPGELALEGAKNKGEPVQRDF
jgi:hypothetical protein